MDSPSSSSASKSSSSSTSASSSPSAPKKVVWRGVKQFTREQGKILHTWMEDNPEKMRRPSDDDIEDIIKLTHFKNKHKIRTNMAKYRERYFKKKPKAEEGREVLEHNGNFQKRKREEDQPDEETMPLEKKIQNEHLTQKEKFHLNLLKITQKLQEEINIDNLSCERSEAAKLEAAIINVSDDDFLKLLPIHERLKVRLFLKDF